MGYNESLKQAVHLAKSGITYPNKSLNVLITAESGTGKSLFAKTMYDYAVEIGVRQINATYLKLK